MCLTVPSKVLEMRGDRAVVTSRGWTREIDARQVTVRPGDFVVVVGGVAIMSLDPREAKDMLAAWDEVEGADA